MQFKVFANHILSWPQATLTCALGRSGIIADKWEGDGGTPIGHFPLRHVFYRPDREPCPNTQLPLTPLNPNMGWCDDPAHPDYNHLVTLPHPASCETLWREDEIYNLIVVLGHNDDPVIPQRGSAIFLHLARPDFSPTQGCVALSRADLLSLLNDAKLGDEMAITDEIHMGPPPQTRLGD